MILREEVLLLRKMFFVYSTILVFCIVFNGFMEDVQAKEEEEKKSELAKLMCEIDKHYKVLERLATYFSLEEIENERKIYGNASAHLAAFCKTAATKFARQGDDTYQSLNSAMLAASETINDALTGTENNSTLEDVLWQAGLLRQSCADCHKHLDIKFGR